MARRCKAKDDCSECQEDHDDAMREQGRRGLEDWMLEQIDQRRLWAGLPFPLCGIMMTLDEVEEMIREAR